MKTKLQKLRILRPGNLLTACFLLFVVIVSLGSLPEALYEAGKALHWKTGVQEFISTIDDYSQDFLPFDPEEPALLDKATYINLNGLMAKQLGQPTLNDRTVLKNGLLASISDTAPEEADLQEAAENLINFCREQEKTGGKFLFVMAPSKISKYEDVLPVGFTDTDNDTADRLIQLLEAGGVPVLDLRQTLHDSGIAWEEAFFVTDHHWTPQTGFLAFQEITKALTEIGATEVVDSFYTDESNYTFHTYEDTFLGSAGKRTGIYYAGIDDSIFIVPNFPTDICLTIPEKELQLQGSYQQVSYHQEVPLNLEDPDYFNENMYALYGWGDRALSQWRNDNAPVQQRLLLMGDSFANVPFSLMSICYSSCDEVDQRHFDTDFAQYYAEYQPQTVVFLINPNNCSSEFTHYNFLN